MTKLKTTMILTAIFFTGLASAATFEVRYPLAATTSFAAPVVPPVVPPTEPSKPVEPEEPKFDLSPWQNVLAKSLDSANIRGSYIDLSTDRSEIVSKNNDIREIQLGSSQYQELVVFLIDTTQKRDWTDFKNNAKTVVIKFKTNPITITCQPTWGNTAKREGQGISAACAKINTTIDFDTHKDSEGKVELSLGFY